MYLQIPRETQKNKPQHHLAKKKRQFSIGFRGVLVKLCKTLQGALGFSFLQGTLTFPPFGHGAPPHLAKS